MAGLQPHRPQPGAGEGSSSWQRSGAASSPSVRAVPGHPAPPGVSHSPSSLPGFSSPAEPGIPALEGRSCRAGSCSQTGELMPSLGRGNRTSAAEGWGDRPGTKARLAGRIFGGVE